MLRLILFILLASSLILSDAQPPESNYDMTLQECRNFRDKLVNFISRMFRGKPSCAVIIGEIENFSVVDDSENLITVDDSGERLPIGIEEQPEPRPEPLLELDAPQART